MADLTYAEHIAAMSDDALWDRAGTPDLAWADACRELHRRLVEARREVRDLTQIVGDVNRAYQQECERSRANAQIFEGEQATLKLALGHLEKLWKLAQDADEDFNFSEKGYPD